MRILISADIEGISGVMSPEQTSPGSGEYERARLLMTREVNAAVEGALEGGATEIWVADGHGQYNNILLEELHPGACLVSGKPRLFGMMIYALTVTVLLSQVQDSPELHRRNSSRELRRRYI